MNLSQLFQFINKNGINIWVENGQLHYSAPRGTISPNILQELTNHKLDLIEILEKKTLAIPKMEKECDDLYPATTGQESLWFQYLLEGSSATYNISGAIELSGNLNLSALEKSINKLSKRHSILRTTFTIVNDCVFQKIHQFKKQNLSEVEINSTGEKELTDILLSESMQPFDLNKGPLYRFCIYRITPSQSILLLTIHHIISDGWSLGILLNEIIDYYQAFTQNHSFLLPDLPIQFSDYASWQRHQISGKYLEYLLDFWKHRLIDAPPVSLIPGDYPRPLVQTFEGNNDFFEIDAALTNKLKLLSQQFGSSLYMVLLAAFVVMVWKYSNQDDISIGTPNANRDRKEIEQLIGLFINTLVLRFNINEDISFIEFLSQVKQTTVEALENKDLPFDILVKELRPERNSSYSPLFQIMFTFQNLPFRKFNLQDLIVSPLQLKNSTSKFDLELTVEELDQHLNCVFEYNTNIYDPSTIHQMTEHYITLLKSIVKDPEKSLIDLRYMTDAEYKKVLLEWNDTSLNTLGNSCFPQIFEKQAELSPNDIAAFYGDESITYQELNSRANQWAWLLIQKGVGPDVLVALLFERSIEFLIAVLAVFKAGGAFLPLDPLTPVERINQIITQSQVSIIFTTNRFTSLFSTNFDITEQSLPKVCIFEKENNLLSSTVNPPSRCKLENLAYVIFTSGSTGTPKGAMIEHKGMLNHLYAKIHTLKLCKTDIIAQTASQSFDISVWQLIVAFLVGAKTRIYPDEITHDPSMLFKKTQTDKITILEVVPSVLKMIINELEIINGEFSKDIKLRWLIITGETLVPSLSRKWLGYYPDIPLLNAYGPTECSDDVTHYPIYSAISETTVITPIGRPISNIEIYILDKHLHPVAPGICGEIYVGGIGVGRGYINDLERTKEVFIDNPFTLIKNSSLYKTGDLGRFLKDGNVEFLGRADYQVKIRGHRIEIEEVEQNVRQHPVVQDAIIVASPDQNGENHLIAYLVIKKDKSITTSELRDFLIIKLPTYMIPSVFVFLDVIPLTPNGKVNRKLLPAPDINKRDLLKEELILPRNKQEAILYEVWKEVLQVNNLSILDNFFDLGGDSLKAVRIVNKLKGAISLIQIFQYPIIQDLAKCMNLDIDRKNQNILQLLSLNNNESKITLICIPYASGSGVIFYPLAKALPDYIKLYAAELPGHDYGFKDEVNLSLKEIVNRCVRQIKNNIGGPVAIYGHCVGTALAIELANSLREENINVQAIFLAGGLPFQQKRVPGFLMDPFNYFVPDSTIINFLKSLDGFNDLENPEDPEQIKFMIRNFRHDSLIALKYFEKFRKNNTFIQLETPINFIVGDKDPVTAYYSTRADEWKTFSKKVYLDVIPNANHFFIKENVVELSRIITNRLESFEIP